MSVQGSLDTPQTAGIPRHVSLGGYVSAVEYMRPLIRSVAMDQQDRRLRDGSAADETRRGGSCFNPRACVAVPA